MIELLIENAFTYGVFAGLFVWLLYTTNRRNECREQMYQTTIRENQSIISEQAKAFGSMSTDVSEIKNLLFQRRSRE
ncbi:MAG: BhlA/UviB family holin-like peptide [Turicibacter sp.]|nr:BhlA/UviB family holin-like peptide [Turicibacter sp.]